jgi:23S rRNA pseudouridine1911/1915/1917 synthase
MTEEPEISATEQEYYEHFRFVVDPGQTPLRIDKFLFNHVAGVSRTRIQAAAEAGCIRVHEKPVKSNYKIKPHDLISVVLSTPPVEIELIPENIPLDILYEDSDMIIVDKKAGMVVHPGVGNYNGTMLNALLYHCENHVKAKGAKPYLLHRIDKDTSGLLVVALHETAQAKLARQFFEHTVARLYQALVWGDFEEEEGRIEGHIGRSLKNRKVMDVFPDGKYGKEAITHYRVAERFRYVTLVECRLETGRTHQIRAHMKYIRHPLFNDATYGGDQILKGTSFTKYKQFVQNCFNLIPGQALHAQKLGFIHPGNGNYIEFESPLPAGFLAVLNKWRSYTTYKDPELSEE